MGTWKCVVCMKGCILYPTASWWRTKTTTREPLAYIPYRTALSHTGVSNNSLKANVIQDREYRVPESLLFVTGQLGNTLNDVGPKDLTVVVMDLIQVG